MGNPIGNVIGLTVGLSTAVLTFFVGRAGLVTFIVASYAILAFLWIMDRRTRPVHGMTSTFGMSDSELDLYRMFHTAIMAPGAGPMFSALLNMLRLSGILFALYGFWNREWILGALSAAYFLVSSGPIARFDPILYATAAARSGDANAAALLEAIEYLRRKRERNHSFAADQ